MSLLQREQDTICAIATPPGPGGIGVVRVSGPDALNILEALFSPRSRSLPIESHRMRYGWIKDPGTGEVVDECLAVFMKAPRTYTREDVVEIQCHSSHAVLRRILDLCIAQGARLAEPGEFTKRAFLNGRIDLSQAEALMYLIGAQTERQRALAVSGLVKGASRAVANIRTELLECLAHMEVALDFPDEDVEIMGEAAMEVRLENAASQIQRILSTYREGSIIREGARIVLAGRPNVGKSSLFNAILGMGRVIVSPVPGTTRDLVEESVDIEGLRVTLVDTAGIRALSYGAEVETVEGEGIQMAIHRLSISDLALVVLDLSDQLREEDIEVFAHLPQGLAFVVVFNKADLVADPLSKVKEMKEVLDQKVGSQRQRKGVFLVSAKTQKGLKELKQGIFEILLGGDGGLDAAPYGFCPNLRQKECLERALQHLESAVKGLRQGMPLEILAMDVRGAIEAMDEIDGKTVQGDLLDSIFSRFCLGK